MSTLWNGLRRAALWKVFPGVTGKPQSSCDSTVGGCSKIDLDVWCWLLALNGSSRGIQLKWSFMGSIILQSSEQGSLAWQLRTNGQEGKSRKLPVLFRPSIWTPAMHVHYILSVNTTYTTNANGTRWRNNLRPLLRKAAGKSHSRVKGGICSYFLVQLNTQALCLRLCFTEYIHWTHYANKIFASFLFSISTEYL